MATRNIPAPSNPYASGAIVFDSAPYVEYYLREQQKEDAKSEALDKYYQEEMSKVSPAGMRANDLPIFNDKFNELKKTWIENKEAIKNPTKYGFEKAQQFNQLKADLMSIPVESKKEKEVEDAVLKILIDPTKKELVDINALNEQMRLQKMPIRTEGRKSIDLYNMPFLAKEYTPQEKLAYFKSVMSTQGKEGSFGTTVKIDKFTNETPYTEQYSESALRQMGDIVRQDAARDARLIRTTKSDFEKISPDRKLELDAIHRKYYKRPIQSAEDLAAATVVELGELAKKEERKREEDRVAKFNANQARIDARTARLVAAQGGQLDPQIAIDEIYDLGEETNLGYRIKAGGDLVYGKEVTLPSELESDFFDKVNGKIKRPQHTVMSHDKSKLYFIYKDEDGKVDESKSRVVNVPTDLRASIAKNYGGTVFTRRNLFTGGRSGQQKTGRIYKGLDKNGNPIFE
jgi:hypothetical protein